MTFLVIFLSNPKNLMSRIENENLFASCSTFESIHCRSKRRTVKSIRSRHHLFTPHVIYCHTLRFAWEFFFIAKKFYENWNFSLEINWILGWRSEKKWILDSNKEMKYETGRTPSVASLISHRAKKKLKKKVLKQCENNLHRNIFCIEIFCAKF